MYNTFTIADYFIKKANDESRGITPMQLNKLVYYAHGWHLALLEKPLLTEGIYVYEYGPIIKSLLKEFAEYGSYGIPRLAESAREFHPFRKKINDDSKEVLDEVWEGYRTWSGLQLSTGARNTIKEAMEFGHNFTLNNDIIKKYFTGLIKKSEEPIEEIDNGEKI